MNWKIIFLLSLLGLGIGITTIFYVPAKYESLLWTPAFVLSAYFIARHTKGKFFLHGFVLGIANTLWATAAHTIMIDSYMAHHTADAAQYAKMSAESGATPAQAMLLMGAFIALLSGIVLGLFSLAAGKIMIAVYQNKTR